MIDIFKKKYIVIHNPNPRELRKFNVKIQAEAEAYGQMVVKCTKGEAERLQSAGFNIYPNKIFRKASFQVPDQVTYEAIANTSDKLGAKSFYSKGFTGKGVKVNVLDTGIDKYHKMLKDRVIAENIFFKSSFPYSNNPDYTPMDFSGHGTWAASALAGNEIEKISGGTLKTFRGMATSCGILNAKVLNKHGYGYYDSILFGIQWGEEQGCDLHSASLGSTSCYQPMHDLLEQIDTPFIFAAGNSGPRNNTILCPAHHPKVIAVGACASENPEHGFVADFSSRGDPYKIGRELKPDFLAYGGCMDSSQNPKYPRREFLVGADTSQINAGDKSALDGKMGTSMATPHLAGMIALLTQKYGKQNSDFWYDKLRELTKNNEKDNTEGFGIPDLKNDDGEPPIPPDDNKYYYLDINCNSQDPFTLKSYPNERKWKWNECIMEEK